MVYLLKPARGANFNILYRSAFKKSYCILQTLCINIHKGLF